MRRLLVSLGALALVAGCGRNIVHARAPVAGQATVIDVDVPGTGLGVWYLIDPLSETCVLVIGTSSPSAVLVSCAALAAHLPEARAHITWTGSASPAPREGVEDAAPAVPAAPVK